MCSTKVIPSCCSPSRPRGVFIPRAREGQCLPAWVRRAAHWQGRAASAVCEKRVAASSRIELADPRRRRGILRRLYKSTPGCFEHIACRFPASARHANPVLHIRPCNPRRNPWLPTNQSICSRAREGIILVAGLVAVPGVGHAPTLVEPEVLPALDRFLGNLQGERDQ
jgi:hypothetical protein